jgi:hypothetical protein
MCVAHSTSLIKKEIVMPRFLTAVLLLALAAPAFSQPQRVEQVTLVCRMGGSMVWSVINQMDAMQTQINGKSVRIPVISALFAQLIFNKATVAVSPTGAGLSAGTCGWTDRGMTATEPNRVIEQLDRATFQATVMYGNGSTIQGGTSMGGGHLNPQNNSVFTMTVSRDPTNHTQLMIASGTAVKVLGK